MPSPSECRQEPCEQESLPRVALCFCGFLSTFKDPSSQDPNTYSQIKQLVAAVGPADVFCSVNDSTDQQRAASLLSPKSVEIRGPMPNMKEMMQLGEDPDIDVMQACYPMSDPEAAGKQAMGNGFVFWGIHHAHSLMVKEEEVRKKKYDIVLRMRYDLTFEQFFWTEAGAKTFFAYGLKSPPPVGSRVTCHQLTILQNIDHELFKVHKMVEYGHLTAKDTVERVKKFVQDALDTDSSVETVTTPAIHTWGGCNDQFGFGTRRAMDVYAGAWDRYHSLIKKKEAHGVTPGFFETLQTEKCLEKTLQQEGIGIIRSHEIVARIFRPNGDVSTQ
eukprot:TRINITY_DN76898_c0_g1_i1.p1 TRINITY_DN76898_c0_g1~~TRINITY_DN76898_c0_g1_i1.p1  ORF type:complete len:354 (+),score=51.38 TRINITY_DN76898_c0_g1_i1:72-1064(+)